MLAPLWHLRFAREAFPVDGFPSEICFRSLLEKFSVGYVRSGYSRRTFHDQRKGYRTCYPVGQESSVTRQWRGDTWGFNRDSRITRCHVGEYDCEAVIERKIRSRQFISRNFPHPTYSQSIQCPRYNSWAESHLAWSTYNAQRPKLGCLRCSATFTFHAAAIIPRIPDEAWRNAPSCLPHAPRA